MNALATRDRKLFTYLTGQYENLGDALLRRGLVESLGSVGRWHVYIGSAPDDYVRALHLPANVVVYRSPFKWFVAATTSMLRRRQAVFVTNPGEISSTHIELALGCMSAVVLAAGKLGRNPGFRLGVGARDRKRPLSIGHEAVTRLVTRNVWRDPSSRRMYGRGDVAPDWAFALASRDTGQPRTLVALSYRGDRPRPSDAALRAVADWSSRRGLEVVVVTQVARDLEASEVLAARLTARHIFAPSGDLGMIEDAVRDTYARSAVVLSNRIHVLIVAAIDGAAPGAIIAHPDVKIARTLAAAGMQVEALADRASPEEIATYLDRVLASSQGNSLALETAAKRLGEVVADVVKHTQDH